jgi:cytochrome c5
MKKIIFLFVVVAVAGFAYADSKESIHSIDLPVVRTELKAGDGKVMTETHCAVCHSLDYITMQPKFSRAQWTAVVNKMLKVMGAPINETDAKVIINYLTSQYGTGE